MSLVPICLGVAVTGITDVQLNFMGVFYGLGCVVISVLTQIVSPNPLIIIFFLHTLLTMFVFSFS